VPPDAGAAQDLLAKPFAAAAPLTPDSSLPFGSATNVPATRLTGLVAAVVGIAATPDGHGYWLATGDGGVFAFGDAAYLGSAAGTPLNQPVVGIAATPDGHGYWLATGDGGVFAFGDAAYLGSAAGAPLNQPVVGIAATPDGHGYWLATGDGGVFAFGDAAYLGSAAGTPLNQPVVGIAGAPDGHGYWLAASDGGVFAFGDAAYLGSAAGTPLNPPVVGMAAAPDGHGYWLVTGEVPDIGDAIAAYVATRTDNVTAAVYDIRTGRTYTYRSGVVEHTASTVKVDILATLLYQTQASGPLSPADQALAVPMIEDSLDSAADVLWVRVGASAVGDFEQAAGMTATEPATDGVWGTTTTTALDRLAMLRTLVFPNPLLTDTSRSYLLNLMEHVTPSQDWGATGGVPAGVTVALKNGFSQIIGWQINTTGWVSGDGHDYLIAVLTDGNPSEDYGIQTVNAVSGIVWNELGRS